MPSMTEGNEPSAAQHHVRRCARPVDGHGRPGPAGRDPRQGWLAVYRFNKGGTPRPRPSRSGDRDQQPIASRAPGGVEHLPGVVEQAGRPGTERIGGIAAS
jgi:hypothetical protein